jgi:hypothetical protein
MVKERRNRLPQQSEREAEFRQQYEQAPMQGEPSTLHLFTHEPAKRNVLRQKEQIVVKNREESTRALSAFEKLTIDSRHRLDRLQALSKDLKGEMISLHSERVYGGLYLKMYDELQQYGATDQDIMDFYRQTLTLHFQSSKIADESRIESGGVIKSKNGDRVSALLLQDTDRDKPAWYTGEQKWEDFLRDHSTLVFYLNPDVQDQYRRKEISLKDIERLARQGQFLHTPTKEDTPDWYDACGENPPDLELVKNELADDTLLYAKTFDRLKNVAAQAKYLLTRHDQKLSKLTEKFGSSKEQYRNNNFTDLILYLNQDVDPNDFDILLNPDEEMGTVFNGKSMPNEKFVSMILESYLSLRTNRYNQEHVAVWIEKQLRDGQVIQSADDQLKPHLRAYLLSVIDASLDDTTGEELEQYKDTEKKAYKVLKYEARPLLKLLSSEDLLFLKEAVAEFPKTETVESIIWLSAELLSHKLQNVADEPAEKQTSISIDHMNQYTEQWVKKNWHWSFSRLRDEIREIDVVPVQSSQQESEIFCADAHNELVIKPLDLEEEVADIDCEARQMREGNLSGWQLQYAPKRRSDKVDTLEGETIDDRVQSLKQYIKENNIPCSIKPLSIINAFDDLVSAPDVVEWIRMRKQIGDEEFKKIKRGKVRILYQLFPEDRIITFFLHQKKADSYGF